MGGDCTGLFPGVFDRWVGRWRHGPEVPSVVVLAVPGCTHMATGYGQLLALWVKWFMALYLHNQFHYSFDFKKF